MREADEAMADIEKEEASAKPERNNTKSQEATVAVELDEDEIMAQFDDFE